MKIWELFVLFYCLQFMATNYTQDFLALCSHGGAIGGLYKALKSGSVKYYTYFNAEIASFDKGLKEYKALLKKSYQHNLFTNKIFLTFETSFMTW